MANRIELLKAMILIKENCESNFCMGCGIKKECHDNMKDMPRDWTFEEEKGDE